MAKLVHSVRLSIPHVDRVRTPCTIQRPDPSADRARPQLLTTIALAAWGAGVLLTVGLARIHGSPNEMQELSMSAALGQLRPAEPEAEPEPEPEKLAVVDPPQGHQPLHQTRAPQATPVPPVASAGQAVLPASTPVASNPVSAPQGYLLRGAVGAPAPGRRRAKRVFEQGIVAYIRCGGVSRARASCLRDRKFEEQVWLTLAKLPACSEGDPGAGSAELRWTMYKTDQAQFDWRAGVDGTSLNLRAIAKCAGEKLANTRTRLRAQQAVVTFRFSLK